MADLTAPYVTRATITIDYADGTSHTYTAHDPDGYHGMTARVAVKPREEPELDWSFPTWPMPMSTVSPFTVLFTIENIGLLRCPWLT